MIVHEHEGILLKTLEITDTIRRGIILNFEGRFYESSKNFGISKVKDLFNALFYIGIIRASD